MRTISRRLLLTTAIATIITLSGRLARASVYPKLPDDVQVHPPAPDVSRDVAAMSGIWEGTLSSIAMTIAVTDMTSDGATVWMANNSGVVTGGVPIEEKSGSGSGKYQGKYSGNKIKFDGLLPNRISANVSCVLELNPDHTLQMSASSRMGTFKGQFNRRA